MPGCHLSAICQPDGDELLGDQPRHQDQDGGALPQRARHGRASWRAILKCRSSEINYVCAGINHMAFYLRFEHNGEDLYPRIRQVLEARPRARRATWCATKCLSAWATLSPNPANTSAEYVPWFIKRDRPDLIEEFNIPLDEYITPL